jgi:hypothetical protein
MGLETKKLFGLMILIIVLALFVIVALGPAFEFRVWGSAQIDFRDFCIFWSLDGYKGETVIINEVEKHISEYCLPALGKLIWSPSDKQECENLCRLNL